MDLVGGSAYPDPKKTGYQKIFCSDTGFGYPKISNYPPTLVNMYMFKQESSQNVLNFCNRKIAINGQSKKAICKMSSLNIKSIY